MVGDSHIYISLDVNIHKPLKLIIGENFGWHHWLLNFNNYWFLNYFHYWLLNFDYWLLNLNFNFFLLNFNKWLLHLNVLLIGLELLLLEQCLLFLLLLWLFSLEKHLLIKLVVAWNMVGLLILGLQIDLNGFSFVLSHAWESCWHCFELNRVSVNILNLRGSWLLDLLLKRLLINWNVRVVDFFWLNWGDVNLGCLDDLRLVAWSLLVQNSVVQGVSLCILTIDRWSNGLNLGFQDFVKTSWRRFSNISLDLEWSVFNILSIHLNKIDSMLPFWAYVNINIFPLWRWWSSFTRFWASDIKSIWGLLSKHLHVGLLNILTMLSNLYLLLLLSLNMFGPIQSFSILTMLILNILIRCPNPDIPCWRSFDHWSIWHHIKHISLIVMAALLWKIKMQNCCILNS